MRANRPPTQGRHRRSTVAAPRPAPRTAAGRPTGVSLGRELRRRSPIASAIRSATGRLGAIAAASRARSEAMSASSDRATPFSHHLRERPVRDAVAVRQAAARSTRASALDAGNELTHEPRLPHPGARSRSHPAPHALDAPSQRPLQLPTSALATDERASRAARGRCPSDRTAYEAVDVRGAGFPLACSGGSSSASTRREPTAYVV